MRSAAQWRPWLWRLPSPRCFAVFGFGRFQISAKDPLSSCSIRFAKIGAGKEGSSSSDGAEIPPLARTALEPLVVHLTDLQARIKALEAELLAWHRRSAESRRLETIPGVGYITATAIAAGITAA